MSWTASDHDTGMFWYVARQLSSVSSPCVITKVVLSVFLHERKHERVKDDCKIIDEALSSDKFPLLHCLELNSKLPRSYFPNLDECGLLTVKVVYFFTPNKLINALSLPGLA